ncbi:beta-phosphoglucomutase [Glacieibacterium megasporae]|uniref:beta-phosphoglucomutase n=1 Tax=Glacieibacterium megasporae TaxID=2835787 RepID=UPI001CAA4BE6|nr:beta-phosphoglucomutase [Polymorphobacter megasporae]UAJ08909.1 beta-phosphoglucomutase [Polymorphobacter megasporae]
MVGIRGSLDECAEHPDTIFSDAYISRPISYHESFPGYARTTDTRILCPSPVLVRLIISGEPVDFATATITHFSRSLNLATGQQRRTTRWRLIDGREIEIDTDRIVPMVGRAIVASRFRLTSLDFSGEVALLPRFGASAGAGAASDADPRISARLAPPWLQATAEDGSSLFTCGDIALAYRQSIAGDADSWTDDADGGGIVAHLAPGDALAFDRIVELTRAADRSLQALPAYDLMAEQQETALAEFWAVADCAVADDPSLTQALRFGLFQLFQSASRRPDHGTAAKGLTSDGYEGHYFWDAEAFILPVLAFTAPSLARSVIEFRMATLAAARANARQMGFTRGALYPWRTIGGGECSSHYPTGAAQVHLNGDIAYAIKFYVDVTGDSTLRRDAAELLFETARIWIDLGSFDPRRDNAFCIRGVTGPDEYTILVDNDFYTNAVARLHLSYAAATADWMKAEHKAAYLSLVASVGLTEAEVAGWVAAARHMWLPVDAQQNVNPQDDTFLDKPVLAAHLLHRPRRPLLLDHHPMTLSRHRLCKQGDVIQALAMGLVDQPLSLTARNYAFYEPVTSHDSTLSAPAFGIIAARIGAFGEARRFIEEAALVDLEDRHGNTGDGLHLAALAGGWLILAQGWGGLAVRGGELHFAPRSAPEFAAYNFTLSWQGSRLQVAVDPDGATYSVMAGGTVTIVEHGRRDVVGALPVRFTRPKVRAVIFDLDGVLTDTAEHHFLAWSALAERHGLAFDRTFNKRLKGVDRASSLRLILDRSGRSFGDSEFETLLAEKNAIYQGFIADYSPSDLFDGVRDLLAACRSAGIMTAVASASRNAASVIARLGIGAEFDFIADAAAVANPKPAPDIFLACAAALGVLPGQCVGVEDAQAGIDAIRAAGMVAVGIDAEGALSGAAVIVPDIAHLDMATIGSLL